MHGKKQNSCLRHKGMVFIILSRINISVTSRKDIQWLTKKWHILCSTKFIKMCHFLVGFFSEKFWTHTENLNTSSKRSHIFANLVKFIPLNVCLWKCNHFGCTKFASIDHFNDSVIYTSNYKYKIAQKIHFNILFSCWFFIQVSQN